MTGSNRQPLPPIINEEDDVEFPFMKSDFFSDVALAVSTTDGGGTNEAPPQGARRSQPAVNVNNLSVTIQPFTVTRLI